MAPCCTCAGGCQAQCKSLIAAPVLYFLTCMLATSTAASQLAGEVRSAVQCSAVRCGAVRCGAVRCGAVQCSAQPDYLKAPLHQRFTRCCDASRQGPAYARKAPARCSCGIADVLAC